MIRFARKVLAVLIALSSVAPVFGNESSSGQAAGGHRRFDAQAVRQFADRIKVIEPQSSTAAIWWRWLMTRDLAFVTREIHKLIQSEGDLFAASDVLDDLGRFIDRNRADGQYSVIENQLVTMKLSQAISAVSASLKVNDMQANCIVAALSGEPRVTGALLAQACMRSVNLNAQMLGTEVEAAHLAAYISATKPRVLAIAANSRRSNATAMRRKLGRLAQACKRTGAEFVVGGDGLSPDLPDYGYRCNSFVEFGDVLRSIRA